MYQYIIRNKEGIIVFYSGHYYHTPLDAEINGNWDIRDNYDYYHTVEVPNDYAVVEETEELVLV